MLTSPDDVIGVAAQIYGAAQLTKPFKLLHAVSHVRAGRNPSEVAREIRTTRNKVLQVVNADDPIGAVFGIDLQSAGTAQMLARARKGVGQMLVGTLAERSFAESYRNIVQPDELRLEDTTVRRTDTDYRVFDGRDRPVFRINIKFHGSLFRKAPDLVDLAANDCFALATYKIHSATKKQREEFIPYLFVIVSVPGLTSNDAGSIVPDDLAHLTSLYMRSLQQRKRDFEDLVVRHMIDTTEDASVRGAVEEIWGRIDAARWRVISARRADRLLHELLFERVYAVRVRAFASNYGRAEVDMHFSIRNDLTSLEDMLELLRDHGLQGLTARIERADL